MLPPAHSWQGTLPRQVASWVHCVPTPDTYCCVPCIALLQLPEVIYTDDPRMFGLLGELFPRAKLVQDSFHLMDRFSRTIKATNTMKCE